MVNSRSLIPLGRACVSRLPRVGFFFMTSSTTRSHAVARSCVGGEAADAGAAGADGGPGGGAAMVERCAVGGDALAGGALAGRGAGAAAAGRRASARAAAGSDPVKRLAC